MRIATFNVNGVNGRLPVLLRWLEQAKPDIVCLQELKAPQGNFPEAAILDAGYGAVWHGQKSWNGVAILARGTTPVETRRGLPGDADDEQSRYIEAAVNGVLIACVYLPNGNPAPGPKFDYKLRWFERLATHAAELLASEAAVVLAGDFNVMPTDLDVYKPERWLDDALFRPEVRDAFQRLIVSGWVDAIRKLHPHERIYTFWDYFRNAWGRDAGLRIDHLLLNAPAAKRLTAAGVDREVRGWEKASDHAPAWICLADGGAKAPTARRARKSVSAQVCRVITVSDPSDTSQAHCEASSHHARRRWLGRPRQTHHLQRPLISRHQAEERVADPIVFDGTVEWSGENPGISLKERPDGRFVALASFFRVVLSPHGRGHVLVLIQSPDEGSPRGERQNYCLHDNEPLARYLVTDFVSHFGAYKGLSSIGSLLYRRLDSVEPSGDPSSAYSERVKAGDLTVDLTWRGLGRPFCFAFPPDKSATGKHHMPSLFVGCEDASIVVNGRALPGKPVPREIAGHTISTAMLAFSETWIRAD